MDERRISSQRASYRKSFVRASTLGSSWTAGSSPSCLLHHRSALNRECATYLGYLKLLLPPPVFHNYFPFPSSSVSDSTPVLDETDRLIRGLQDGTVFSIMSHRLYPQAFPQKSNGATFTPGSPTSAGYPPFGDYPPSPLHSFASLSLASPSSERPPSSSEAWEVELEGHSSTLGVTPYAHPSPNGVPSLGQNQRRFAVMTSLHGLLEKLCSTSVRLLPSPHTVSAQAIMDGDPATVLDMVWLLIRGCVLHNVDVDRRPELVWLMHDQLTAERKLTDLMRLSRESLLLLWANYHLARAGSHRQVQSLSRDFNDAVVYAILVGHLAPPDRCDQEQLRAILEIEAPASPEEPYMDPQPLLDACLQCYQQRFELLKKNLQLLGIDMDFAAQALAQGHRRCHLMLLGLLFDRYPGLSLLPREDDWQWIQDELRLQTDRSRELARDYDNFRQQMTHDIQNAQEQQMQERHRIESEFQEASGRLKAQVKALQVAMHKQQAASDLNVQQLCGDFDHYRQSVDGSLCRTVRLLQAYADKRQDMLKEATVYTITAFNNQGKRMTFHIPAPALKSKCDFRADEVDRQLAQESSECGMPFVYPQRDRQHVPESHEPRTTRRLPSPRSPPPPPPPSHLPVPSPSSSSLSPGPSPVQSSGTQTWNTCPLADVEMPLLEQESRPVELKESSATLGAQRVASEFAVSRRRCWSCPPDLRLELRQQLSLLPCHAAPLLQDDDEPSPSLNNKCKKRPNSRTLTVNSMLVDWEERPLSSGHSTLLQPDELYSAESPVELRSGGEERQDMDLPAEIHRLVLGLVEDHVEKLQQIQLLAAKVDEMTWLNHVMGEKIKTFSEQLIQQTHNNSSSSKLPRRPTKVKTPKS